jgi:hypothetical protein
MRLCGRTAQERARALNKEICFSAKGERPSFTFRPTQTAQESRPWQIPKISLILGINGPAIVEANDANWFLSPGIYKKNFAKIPVRPSSHSQADANWMA